jgi:hypothetical protein
MIYRKLNAGRGRQYPILRHPFTSPIVPKSFDFPGKTCPCASSIVPPRPEVALGYTVRYRDFNCANTS